MELQVRLKSKSTVRLNDTVVSALSSTTGGRLYNYIQLLGGLDLSTRHSWRQACSEYFLYVTSYKAITGREGLLAWVRLQDY